MYQYKMANVRALICITVVSLTLFYSASATSHEETAAVNNQEETHFLNQFSEEKQKTRAKHYDQEREDTNIITGIIGRKAHIKSYPYTAAVITRTNHEGSAVILNKRWVLTSGWVALYEDPANVLVRFGSDSAIDKGKTTWASKLIIHPNYENSWEYDLALIKLKKPLKYSKNVKAIQIAKSAPKKGDKAVVSGYGLTSQNDTSYSANKQNTPKFKHDGWLRAFTTEIFPYDDCKEYYKFYTSFTNTSFCTTARNDSGPCFYDYGSPLVVNKKLVGIFSGIPSCIDLRYPPVYTDIIQFKDWIGETIKNHTHPTELHQLEKDIQYHG